MNTMMMMMMLQIPLLCQEGFIVQHPFIAVCTGNRSLAFDIINLQTASLANQIWMGLASDSHHRVADPVEMPSRTGREMGFVRRVARQTNTLFCGIHWLALASIPACFSISMPLNGWVFDSAVSIEVLLPILPPFTRISQISTRNGDNGRE